MIFPSKQDFVASAAHGNLIPVYREVVADLVTPVAAYLQFDTGPYNFLLESVERGEKTGRYSFVGFDPSLIFQMKGDWVYLTENGHTIRRPRQGDPLEELEQVMGRFKPVPTIGLPMFYGGAVGYLAYESIRYFEPSVPQASLNDLEMPDALFFVADQLLIFDHQERRLKILVNAFVQDDPVRAYDQAVQKIDAMTSRLHHPVDAPLFYIGREVEIPEPQANMTREQYVAMTEKMQKHIAAGDIFQVVPSQRFEIPYNGRPIDLYRALRLINPSPYMFCLKLGEAGTLVGSSPETHVRCIEGLVEIHPIAGTRPRKPDPQDDEAMELELLSDPKERAEHVMLVDLARNDLGRVCGFHTVKVSDFMTIERYSHVMHIVSHVEGILNPGYSAYDVLRATFPAGTVTGSPKIRAMQIIAEHEPTCRGGYSGAVAYFGFSGNLDSCITIRTILLRKGQAYIQAGGGLVADSTPMGEFNESLNKAKAALKAVALARSMADQPPGKNV